MSPGPSRETPRASSRSANLARVVQRVPGGDLLLWAPRAVQFTRRARARVESSGDHETTIPAAPRGMQFMAAAMMDELTLVLMRTGRRKPAPGEIERIASELQQAVPLFATEGWLDDPLAFHATPPAPSDVKVRRAEQNGVEFERISFESGYEPDTRVPGGERWLEYERNGRARAWVVRSSAREPRPWVVHLHGFGMGRPYDLQIFRSFGYRDRGVNVIHPIFPLHGPRRSGRRSGDGVISFDAMANVHGIAQAIWDTRRCILWAREQGATAIGVHGLSLGAYTAALLAGIEDDLACVVAGIPPADLVTVLARNTPPRSRAVARTGGILGDEARAVHRVVSPLAVAPRVPRDRRFIYAGIGDRMSTAEQAEVLWRHWDRPAILWFPGSHVGAAWTRDVHRFARRAVYSSLLGAPEPARASEGA